DADHAIVVRAARKVELLRAPDCGGGELFVHAGLEFGVVLGERLSGDKKLRVVAAERRTAIAADEAGGVEAQRAVAPDLRHRQAGDATPSCVEHRWGGSRCG